MTTLKFAREAIPHANYPQDVRTVELIQIDPAWGFQNGADRLKPRRRSGLMRLTAFERGSLEKINIQHFLTLANWDGEFMGLLYASDNLSISINQRGNWLCQFILAHDEFQRAGFLTSKRLERLL